jgi:hypothetical protein
MKRYSRGTRTMDGLSNRWLPKRVAFLHSNARAILDDCFAGNRDDLLQSAPKFIIPRASGGELEPVLNH